MPESNVSETTQPTSQFIYLERIAADIGREAARRIRAVAGNAREVAKKSSETDIVTATDIEIESYIEAGLRAATPHSSMLGEEHGSRPGSSELGWIVDPIDGTVNFKYDLPVISVSIAATWGGATVAGVVVDVHRGDVFTAARNRGARLNGRPITANPTSDLATSLIGTGFSYSSSRRAEEAEAVGRVLPQVGDIRCMGSAALNLAWVACGRLDGYYESDVQVWDVAAGALLVGESGGQVFLESRHSAGSVLAAAPGIFDDLSAIANG